MALERIDETTLVSWDGAPCLDPTSGRHGAFVDECLALNEAELEELCRGSRLRAPSGHHSG